MGGGRALALAAPLVLAACGGGGGGTVQVAVQSCQVCHNGTQQQNYAGPGLEDPHPFGEAAGMDCTVCHGGNGDGLGKDDSHVPPPPEIGDDEQLVEDAFAYFNRLTLTGLDKLPDYTVGGQTYTALDYLRFVNPGDLRVVQQGVSCGQCHEPHVDDVSESLLATEAGVLSGALYAAGVHAQVFESQGLYGDTAVDLGFRAQTDDDYVLDPANTGAVSEVLEFPVFSVFGGTGSDDDIFGHDELYDAAGLSDDLNADGSVITGSPLANLYHEQVAFTCGDCHLGSAGANNRYGDFRSSGCTSCHMAYSLDGRSGSGDPNVDLFEPANPDQIEAPERAHVKRHLIASVAKDLPSGETVPGIDDYACAGCHQGSNRTVMQYWGIRLDQNQDLRFGNQYPANPVSFQNTANDPRLFDPEVGNHTFNGRNAHQYIVFEDYDGDGRDDTPADVHYEAGLGCIDCHGSADLHGDGAIRSRMEQAVHIRCESCHGDADGYAPTVTGTTYEGQVAELAMDEAGNPLKHVFIGADGHYYLRSRLTGDLHFVPQTRDTVVDSGVVDPIDGDEVYSALASFAMGRDDGDPSTGLGPQQAGHPPGGFRHGDSMSCESCHSSWTNSCVGCHLVGEYDTGDNFSNITGERIVFEEDTADFVYQSPLFFQLGVGEDGKVDPIAANTKAFFRYEDRHNDLSDVFAFSDRNGNGNDPGVTPTPSLSHNVLMPHSIRGKVDAANEGPRYCVACHLTEDSLDDWGTEYDTFRTAMATGDFASLDFDLLQTHFGLNTGNQLDSPFFVHQAAGLGSGLFLFDANGYPVNQLDDNDDRAGGDGQSPADVFDVGNARYDLDRIVLEDGTSTGSNNHPMLDGQPSPLRDGSDHPELAGPLGATLIEKLADPDDGVVLDSWLDADGAAQGQAGAVVGGP